MAAKSSRRLHDLLRLAAFAAIIFLIRDGHMRFVASQAANREPLTLEQAREFFPVAQEFVPGESGPGVQAVRDAEGRNLGRLLQTSPQSDTVVGFSGSTNVMVAFGPDEKVIGIKVLESGDTLEHLDAVLADESFLTGFNGHTWEELGAGIEVDGVSGATLTSMAIAEGMARRFGGDRPSYRFPRQISIEEVRACVPGCHELQPSQSNPGFLDVLDVDGQDLGRVARTSPAADNIIGYQGPVDTLLVFDPAGRLSHLVMRESFENQPYAGYIPQEASFLGFFQGRTLAELSELDLAAEQVEGVSGATMTSMAMANGIVKAAGGLGSLPALTAPRAGSFSLRLRDLGSTLVVLLAFLVAFTRLRKGKTARLVLRLLLIFYLGLVNGDLLSQALLVGWAQSGVPWQFALSLVLLSLAALIVPLSTRKQFYCSHLCPHGAAQQLLRIHVRWKLKVSRRITRMLEWIPILLLGMIVVVAMRHLPLRLVNIEPFDAYVFRLAGWATITIAVVGLGVSAFIPMAYCRFGCPTGAMLNLLIPGGRGAGTIRRDRVAGILLALALLCHWLP